MNPRIRMAQLDDAPAISELVQASFRAHIANDWHAEAQDSFLGETTAEKLATPIEEATFAAVYEEDGHIVAVILLPRPNLVQLCFVATTHLRRGIGTSLWEAARTYLETQVPEIKTVELNASPYAVAAYTAMESPSPTDGEAQWPRGWLAGCRLERLKAGQMRPNRSIETDVVTAGSARQCVAGNF